MSSNRGKLIVIDGTDGSGKATQAKRLLDFLRKKRKKAKYIDFPRYYSSFHGKVVARYLTGEFGTLDQVSPYLASLAYALDRLTAKAQLDRWLREGNIVVANRYTSANMAHQTARLPRPKREEFLEWLYDMEYNVHRLPKEDLVLFLHVPVAIAQKLVDKKGERGYVGGKKRDIHEASLSYLKEAEKMYLELCKRNPYWVRVACTDGKGNLRSIGDIHLEILKILRKRGVI